MAGDKVLAEVEPGVVVLARVLKRQGQRICVSWDGPRCRTVEWLEAGRVEELAEG